MTTHKMLLQMVKTLDSDFEPCGKRSREEDYGPDCSAGCKFFAKVEGLEKDWGVCLNRHSPRSGLLTFEHMGCHFFEEKDAYMD